MRLPIVRRADGLKRDDCCVGSRHERRQLEGVDAEGLLDDVADLPGDRADEHARHARLNELLLGQVRALQRAQIGVLRLSRRRRAAATPRRPGGSGGSDSNTGRSRCIVPDALSVTR